MSRKTVNSQTRDNIKQKRRRRRLHRIRQIFRLILLLIILAIFGWGLYHAYRWSSEVYSVFKADYDAYTQKHEQLRKPLGDRFDGYMNVLVLGVDDGADGLGQQADTILLVSLDNTNGNLRVISVPRGTLVDVEKAKGTVPIAEVYRDEGARGMIRHVRGLLGVTVNYYAVVDLRALSHIVDALDGVDVYVELPMDYEDPESGLAIHLPQGYQHMNGETAQKFLRYRSGELGDIGRVQRQHRFMKAMYERVLQLDTITKAPELARILREEVNTSAEVWDTTQLANIVKSLGKEPPETIMLPGTIAAYDDKLWIPDAAKIQEKTSELFPEPQQEEPGK